MNFEKKYNIGAVFYMANLMHKFNSTHQHMYAIQLPYNMVRNEANLKSLRHLHFVSI